MTIRSFVNFALLAIPIGVTLGILFGLQTHRHATGQAPLFAPKPNDGIQENRYCQKSFGITPDTKGQQYTLNPNQWNWNVGDPGQLCLDVTSFNNKTYATSNRAPEFLVSWQYPPGPPTSPVHAFPNIKVDGSLLPSALNNVSKMKVELEWSYGIGNETKTASTLSDWTDNNLNANVAIDMFIDSDKNNAQDPTKAKFELMVWFAQIGPAAQAIGQPGASAPLDTQVLDGITFDLYSGVNGLEQNVLTWVASKPANIFNGDLTPLIHRLFKVTAADLPKPSDYLGYFALGSETLSADKAVTFYVPDLSIDIETSTSSNT